MSNFTTKQKNNLTFCFLDYYIYIYFFGGFKICHKMLKLSKIKKLLIYYHIS